MRFFLRCFFLSICEEIVVSVEVEKSTTETAKLLAESVSEENTTIKATSNLMKILLGCVGIQL
jgi:hypothetical protein